MVGQVEELRSKGHEPYAYKWTRSHTACQLQDIYSQLANGEECKEDLVSIAGRIIARRAFGKLAFLTLRDDSGTIQVCPVVFHLSSLSSFQSFKHLESHIWVSISISALCACSAVSPKLCEDGLHMTVREFLQCVIVQTQE